MLALVPHRMLPGLNSAAVGLIVGAVFSLTFQIYKNSPFPTTSICIGERPSPRLQQHREQQHSLLLRVLCAAVYWRLRWPTWLNADREVTCSSH